MNILLGLAVTTHLGLNDNYNSIHPHLRIEYERFVSGTYYNSMHTNSLYLGLENTVGNNLTLEVGVVTGYDSINAIIPYTRLSYKFEDNVELFASPTVEKNSQATNLGLVLGFQYFIK